MLWIEGRTARGYGKEDFAEAFRRYIPRGEVETLRAAALEAEAHREAAAPGEGQEAKPLAAPPPPAAESEQEQ